MKMKAQQKEIIPGCEEIVHRGNEVGCLLIHGFRSCPFEMKDFAEYLIEMGFTVQTCLLPGHGTKPEDLLDVKWQDWVKAVEDSFKDLNQRCQKVFVAGLSTGGSLALYLASNYDIKGVIALAPGLFLIQKNAILSHFLKYFWKFKKIKSGPDVSINVESRVYPKVPVSIISELLKLFKSLKSRLNHVKTATLIIYSKNDHVVSPKSSKTIFDKISSQKKLIIELEKSFHILTMDVEKEKVFQESGKFINEIISS